MIDIKFTTDGDIDFTGGDISYTESTRQHQADLIMTQKGHIKEHPEVGVGAINFLHDESSEDFMRAIRKEFTRDGMTVTAIRMVNGNLFFEAKYES